jgi:ATP-dependent exoDNAse (exonuclease V) alpha subunit
VVKEFAGQEIVVQLDNGKTARWDLQRFRHLDFGYVMTSHSSQSMTVDRCLVNVETGDSRLRALHNSTFAYVAGSRPEFDLQVFTDNTPELLKALSRQQEKHKALSPEQVKELAKTA